MEIKKIGTLEIKDTLTGAENALIEENGYAKRVPVAMIRGGTAQQLDPNAFGIPVLALTGDVSAMSKENAVTLSYVYGELSGVLTCKWQGSSSIAYPKKNYTVKFDRSFEAKSGWGAHDKYVLKANWVDASAIRNVFGAVLWGQLIEDRAGLDERLKALPNKGAIDGFPIWITINGQSQGFYTFTIPKEGWLFGMTGANTAEGYVCAEVGTLKEPVVGDGTDFKVEYAAGDKTALIASLNNMIAVVNAVLEGTSEASALDAVVDVQSVIDYYVFMAFTCHDDGISKNYILATYDGVKWFMSPYDMDATFGNEAMPSGAGYGWANDWPMFDGGSGGDYPLGINNLLDVVRKHYGPQIKARFQNLRYFRLGEINYIAELYKLAIQIPEVLMQEDYRLWPGRPGTHTNNLTQMLNYMRVRGAALDWNVKSVE